MGAKLQKYYEIVGEKGGAQAKMRLAMKTGISSVKASSEPDTPENLTKFHEAIEEVLGTKIPAV